MIGPLEIAIIVAILLVIFGAKFLPALGRNAGKALRLGREKGGEVATKVQTKAEGYDPAQIARTAGGHGRDARELRDEIKGTGTQPEPTPAPAAEEDEDEDEEPRTEPKPSGSDGG